MSKLRRFAFLVLVGGVCAAAPFYKPSSLVPPNNETAPHLRKWRTEQLTLQVASRPEVSPAENDTMTAPAFGMPNEQTVSHVPEIRASDSQPSGPLVARRHPTLQSDLTPRLARHYEPVPLQPFSPTPTFSLDPERRKERDECSTKGDGAGDTLELRTIRHKIVDGDTLQDLAQKYLGDRSRASEIFEANRTLLEDPELLPLDEELVITVK